MNHAERSALPHWVYRMFDADGRLLYVGLTYNPTQRLTNWRSCSKLPYYAWVNSVASITWQRFPDRASAAFAEASAIAAERPVANRQHQKRQPKSHRPERFRMRRYFLRSDVLAERCAAVGIQSWSALARVIEIDPSIMTRMAAGERPVQPSQAVALADVLGVHVAHLVLLDRPDAIAAQVAEDAETAA